SPRAREGGVASRRVGVAVEGECKGRGKENKGIPCPWQDSKYRERLRPDYAGACSRRAEKSAEELLPPAAWGLGEAMETVESGRASASASIWDEAMAVTDPLGRGWTGYSIRFMSPGGGGRGLIELTIDDRGASPAGTALALPYPRPRPHPCQLSAGWFFGAYVFPISHHRRRRGLEVCLRRSGLHQSVAVAAAFGQAGRSMVTRPYRFHAVTLFSGLSTFRLSVSCCRLRLACCCLLGAPRAPGA
ncbi:hypothetical protein THAOC_01205, partial [Thalassiosira oceanica]